MAEVIDATGLTSTSTAANNIPFGYLVTMKVDATLLKITKHTNCTATIAYLHTADGSSQLASTAFSGNDAVFSYSLSNGVTYAVTAASGESNYLRWRLFPGPDLRSSPIIGTNVDWVDNGYILGGSWNHNSEAEGIDSITTEEIVTGTNAQLNIGDAWKTISSMKINIGDAWKDVTGLQVNIGDTWKTIF